MLPLISVIVPVYKVEQYLNRCIESIVKQTYKNLEIILVDDGSPDNCPNMCDNWAEKDSRIKVIHKRNGGLSSARNAAMNVITGDYVGFVDSDDYLEHSFYNTLLNELVSADADIVDVGYKYVDTNYNHIKTTLYPPKIIEKDMLISNFITGTEFDAAVWNKLYKRNVIGGIRFDESVKIGEDVIFNYSVLKNANRICVMNIALYNYLFRNDSISHTVNVPYLTRYFMYRNIFEAEKDNKYNYHNCLYKFQNVLFVCLRELLKSKNSDFIAQLYPEMIDEVKQYSDTILSLDDLSRENRLSIKAINISPKLFKLLYSIYLKVKL